MKRAISLSHIPIGCLVLWFAACSDHQTSPSKSRVIQPLSTGTSWSYVSYTYVGDSLVAGLTDSTKQAIVGSASIACEGRQLFVGLMAFFYGSADTPAVNLRWLYWNGADGLYNLGGFGSEDTLILSVLNIKFPAAQGDSWRVPHLVFDVLLRKFTVRDTLVYSCISTGDQLATPVGTFDCHVYHYRIRPEDDVSEYWDYYDYYAPDIGKVGTVIRSSYDGSLKRRQLLYKYTLG